MTFPEDLGDEIAHRVARGFEDRAAVLVWVVETCELTELGLADEDHVSDVGQLDAGVRAQLVKAIDEAFRRKEAEIASWPAKTDCDRLTTAFAALTADGIVAIDDAHEDYALAVERAENAGNALTTRGGPKARGYAFYRDDEVWRAIRGEGLRLQFGSFEEDEPIPQEVKSPCPECQGRGWIAAKSAGDFPTMCPCKKRIEAPRVKPLTRGQIIGAAVAAACRASGLTVEWDGSADSCVTLQPFRWQRR